MFCELEFATSSLKKFVWLKLLIFYVFNKSLPLLLFYIKKIEFFDWKYIMNLAKLSSYNAHQHFHKAVTIAIFCYLKKGQKINE